MFVMLVKYLLIIKIVLRKNHTKKLDDYDDDYDYDNDDDDDDAIDGYGNDTDVITDV